MRSLLILLTTIISLSAGESITAGMFQFTPEKPWVVVDYPSHMVKGALTHGEKGPLLKFYHFGQGQGGGIEANLKRWNKQFEGEAKVTKSEISYGKQKVAIVLMAGTYLDGGIMERKTPKENYALLGAVIPHAQGDVFLKMTGPAGEIKNAQADLKALINSAFPLEKE